MRRIQSSYAYLGVCGDRRRNKNNKGNDRERYLAIRVNQQLKDREKLAVFIFDSLIIEKKRMMKPGNGVRVEYG